MARSAIVIAVVFCILVAGAPELASGITCGQVANSVSGCIVYALRGGVLPLECCSGVKRLNAAAKTTQNKQTVCGCLKEIVRSTPGINMGLVGRIPEKCGVHLGYQVSLSLDCSKVK